MFCPKCGKEISDQSRFCPKCGASISNAGTDSKRGLQQMKLSTFQNAYRNICAIGGCAGIGSLFLLFIAKEISVSNVFYHETYEILQALTKAIVDAGPKADERSLMMPLLLIPLQFIFFILDDIFLMDPHMHSQDGKVSPPVALTSVFLLDAGTYAFLLARVRDVYIPYDSLVDITLTATGWLHIMLLVVMAVCVVAEFAMYIKCQGAESAEYH